MTLKPFTTKSGEELQIGGIARADIPADWNRKAVLARPNERFAFYETPDGQVAEIRYHRMNGWDDLFCRIGSRDFMLGEYQELLDGEPFVAYGFGGAAPRNSRMAKARRIA